MTGQDLHRLISLTSVDEKTNFRTQIERDYSIDLMDTHKEDVKFHEEQITAKKIIKQKIDDYVQTFTIHGLTRIFTSGRYEAWFWLFMVCGGILLCSYMMLSLVTRYVKHEVYSEINADIRRHNTFPSVTFCEFHALIDRYFSYCDGVPDNETCIGRPIKKDNPPAPVYSKNFWSNGAFNVTYCTGHGSSPCVSNDYLQSVSKHQDACFRWNYNGSYTDVYGHVNIAFTFHKENISYVNISTPNIIAFFHDPRILEIDFTRKLRIDPHKEYEITIDQTKVVRLPAPFPSNCSNAKSHIYNGKSSRRSCIESYMNIEIFEKCHDIFDYTLQFIPENIKREHVKRNDTKGEVKKCFREFKYKPLNEKEMCPFPCDEYDIVIIPSASDDTIGGIHHNEENRYTVNLQLQHIDTVRIVEEKELYSWYQMACEIGGFVGLIIGASIISFIELITFFVLSIINKWIK